MDPLSATASLAGILGGIMSLAEKISTLKQNYDHAELYITQTASLLFSVQRALEALDAMRVSDALAASRAGRQLDEDLTLPLESCAVLIALIERQLDGVDVAHPSRVERVRFVALKETFMQAERSLGTQVTALQLLISIYQCGTLAERRKPLVRRNTQRALQDVVDHTASLALEDRDIDDAASILSQDPSVHFVFDHEILQTKQYKAVYKDLHLRYKPASLLSSTFSPRVSTLLVEEMEQGTAPPMPTVEEPPSAATNEGTIREQQAAYRGRSPAISFSGSENGPLSASGSTQAATLSPPLGKPRHRRQRSASSVHSPIDPLIGAHPQLPFLGIPFQGEMETDVSTSDEESVRQDHESGNVTEGQPEPSEAVEDPAAVVAPLSTSPARPAGSLAPPPPEMDHEDIDVETALDLELSRQERLRQEEAAHFAKDEPGDTGANQQPIPDIVEPVNSPDSSNPNDAGEEVSAPKPLYDITTADTDSDLYGVSDEETERARKEPSAKPQAEAVPTTDSKTTQDASYDEEDDLLRLTAAVRSARERDRLSHSYQQDQLVSPSLTASSDPRSPAPTASSGPRSPTPNFDLPTITADDSSFSIDFGGNPGLGLHLVQPSQQATVPEAAPPAVQTAPHEPARLPPAVPQEPATIPPPVPQEPATLPPAVPQDPASASPAVPQDPASASPAVPQEPVHPPPAAPQDPAAPPLPPRPPPAAPQKPAALPPPVPPQIPITPPPTVPPLESAASGPFAPPIPPKKPLSGSNAKPVAKSAAEPDLATQKPQNAPLSHTPRRYHRKSSSASKPLPRKPEDDTRAPSVSTPSISEDSSMLTSPLPTASPPPMGHTGRSPSPARSPVLPVDGSVAGPPRRAPPPPPPRRAPKPPTPTVSAELFPDCSPDPQSDLIVVSTKDSASPHSSPRPDYSRRMSTAGSAPQPVQSDDASIAHSQDSGSIYQETASLGSQTANTTLLSVPTHRSFEDTIATADSGVTGGLVPLTATDTAQKKKNLLKSLQRNKGKSDNSQKTAPRGRPSIPRISFFGNENAVKQRLFHEAVAAGDLPAAQEHLREKPKLVGSFDKLDKDKDAKTPLMRAAAGNFLSLVECLAVAGADYGQTDKDGKIAMHYAIEQEAMGSVSFLTERFHAGYVVPAGHSTGVGPLELPDALGNRPLHLAAATGNTAIINVLLAGGAKINSCDKSGRTPLNSALRAMQFNAFKLLLDRGANMNTFDFAKRNVLMWASEANAQKAVELLLERGVNRYEADAEGNQAVHIAAERGHVNILEMLYLKVVDFEAVNNYGERPLHLAAGAGRGRAAKALLRAGCTPLAFTTGRRPANRKKSGQASWKERAATPLHYACAAGADEVAEALVYTNTANAMQLVNANQDDGTSPLMLAVQAKAFPITRVLLENGANPNARTRDEQLTALHLATRAGDLESTQLLAHNGADHQAQNKKLQSPYRYGSDEGKSPNEAATWLMKHSRGEMFKKRRQAEHERETAAQSQALAQYQQAVGQMPPNIPAAGGQLIWVPYSQAAAGRGGAMQPMPYGSPQPPPQPPAAAHSPLPLTYFQSSARTEDGAEPPPAYSPRGQAPR